MKHCLFNQHDGLTFPYKSENYPLFFPAALPAQDSENKYLKDKGGRNLVVFPLLDNYERPVLDERGYIILVSPKFDDTDKPLIE